MCTLTGSAIPSKFSVATPASFERTSKPASLLALLTIVTKQYPRDAFCELCVGLRGESVNPVPMRDTVG